MPAFTRDDESEIGAVIISESATHVVVAIELNRELLARHRRFLEMLLIAAMAPPA
jgi:hypothetical protein